MPGIRRPTTVPVVEDQGVVRQVPLVTWRTSVLPDLLKRHWTEPDSLAPVVECALEVGAHVEALTAAEHLSRIDPDRERRYALPSVVYARCGRFHHAEELLDRHESLYGESWQALWGRAEVALSGNRRARGLDLLRRALRLDPDASPPLRRLIQDLSHGGAEKVDESVREVARARGSWRARMWLAANASPPDEAERLVRSAVEESRDEREVLAIASGVLASRGLVRAIVEFVAPRYQLDRDRLECGVNLLFGFLSAGRKVPAEALLQRLSPRLEEAGLGEYADFYATALRNLREKPSPEPDPEANVDLLRAMAAAVRQRTAKARRRCWSMLSSATLLVPVEHAWIEMPLFESPWPEVPRSLEIVTGIDSEGREVAIAFTDERTMRAWGPIHAERVSMSMRALLELVAEEKECTLLVNPAGPTATELALPDIEAFLDGRAPSGEESHIRFLAEPLRRRMPEGFDEALALFLTSSGIVREAWLFEIVDDRNGVNPAVAIEFTTDASAEEQRELMVDGPDEVRWGSRRSRRVRFLPLAEGRFADYVRSMGVRIDVR